MGHRMRHIKIEKQKILNNIHRDIGYEWDYIHSCIRTKEQDEASLDKIKELERIRNYLEKYEE